MRSVIRTVCNATAAACLPAIDRIAPHCGTTLDVTRAHHADTVAAESAAPLHPTALGIRANGAYDA